MKKRNILCVVLIVLMVFSPLSLSVSANDDVAVILDGEMLEFDVQPQIINGRTLVPMRKIFESLGASIEWDGNTQTIVANKQGITVVMQINNRVLSVNGNNVELDVPPQLVDGRTLVPVRAVAESFDIHVIWDDSTNTVLLSNFIPFDTHIQTFDYLFNWLIENGKAYGEYVYIGWSVDDGVAVDIRCYPESGNISFYLNSYENDRAITSVSLWKTYDGNDIYATYISGTESCRINGNINMAMHTSNYPLTYKECKPGEFETDYNLLEETRERINYMFRECDILLSAYNTNVTLNTLGFKKH